MVEKLTTQVGPTTVETWPDEGRDEIEQAERHRRKVRLMIFRQRKLLRRGPVKDRRPADRIAA
jgi:hypothetical protein